MSKYARASCRTDVNVCLCVSVCGVVVVVVRGGGCPRMHNIIMPISTGAISAIIGHENLRWLANEVHNACKPELGKGKPKVTST